VNITLSECNEDVHDKMWCNEESGPQYPDWSLENRKTCSLSWGSNHNSMVVRPVAHSLY